MSKLVARIAGKAFAIFVIVMLAAQILVVLSLKFGTVPITPAAARATEIFSATAASNYELLASLASPLADDIYRDRAAIAMSLAAFKQAGVEIIGTEVVAEHTTATRLTSVLVILMVKNIGEGSVVENPVLVILDEELLLIEVR